MGFQSRISRKASRSIYGPMERIYRLIERSQLSRGAVLEHIPPPSMRGGGLGTTTYGEWAYTIGLFATLIFKNLPPRPIQMLDVGCGVGRLYLSVKPYLTRTDHYTGIDIGRELIDICRRQYRAPNVSFVHTPNSNGYYTGSNSSDYSPWPFDNGSMNLVTALSVWTHLREEDWRYYLSEVSRVLSPGGRAIISFFVLDDLYRPERKSGRISDFYPQPENKWIFDQHAYGSKNWLHPLHVSKPEVAIGVPKKVFDKEIEAAGLKVREFLPGQWKDQPGFFFQDVAILEKR